MSFKSRVLLTFLPLALLPLVGFAWIVRKEISSQLDAQYSRVAEALVRNVTEEFDDESKTIAGSVEQIGNLVVNDNRFRSGVSGLGSSDARYVVDYATDLMRLSGLDFLQIQDSNGRILSSGHFRNEFDRLDPALPQLLSTLGPIGALANIRTPTGYELGLLRIDSVSIGNRQLVVVGGKAVGPAFLRRLSPDDSLSLGIAYPGMLVTTNPAMNRAAILDEVDGASRLIEIPFIDQIEGRVSRAALVVYRGTGEINALRASMDRWLLLAVTLGLVLVGIGVAILSFRISEPIAELAEKTALVDLQRLNVDFSTRRSDEIGRLSRTLGKLMRRLRASAAEVRDAERRATQGELARQVNHDIKNGLTPIRNVFSHLVETAQREPEQLPAVLLQRQATIESSIAYLSTLSANYARMSPESVSVICNVSAIIRGVVNGADHPRNVELQVEAPPEALVLADPLSIRRIAENLVDNAIDSINGSGRVFVGVERLRSESGEPLVRLAVEDTGVGLDSETRDRAFEDFFTTKANGTGLGLSIVRRLVLDSGGRIDVASEPGTGSRFTVDFPQATQENDRQVESTRAS